MAREMESSFSHWNPGTDEFWLKVTTLSPETGIESTLSLTVEQARHLCLEIASRAFLATPSVTMFLADARKEVK